MIEPVTETPPPKPEPETICPDGCPVCPCGSAEPSCLCWCDHTEGAVHDHPLMVTLKGIRWAGVTVLGKMLKPDGRFLSAPYPVAVTYANRTALRSAPPSSPCPHSRIRTFGWSTVACADCGEIIEAQDGRCP